MERRGKDRINRVLAVSLLVAVASVPSTAAGKEQEDQPTAARALADGSLSLSLRYRFERVSDDAPAVRDETGRASTLRSALGYRTDRWSGFSLFAELEDVSDLGLHDEHANAGAGDANNGVTDRPVIADAPATEVNQLYLRYRGGEAVTFTLGRQAIKLGNQRFVGPVGWRQNWQTFDAFRVDLDALPRTRLVYAYVDDVNRIFGDNTGMRSHLLDAEISLGDARLVPYVYRLDYDAPANASLSTLTYGARWVNTWKPSDRWRVPYHVELARQRDAADNPGEVDAGYARVRIGVERDHYGIEAGYELLEGAPGEGRFTTPLATLHAFNGWADRFLVTPANGLEDVWIGITGDHGPLGVQLFWHDFASDSGGLDYGSELDLKIVCRSPWGPSFGAGFARYDADDFSFDTDKVWFWTAYGF